jgi:cytochrome c2
VALWAVAAVVAAASVAPVAAQFGGRATRPEVDAPQGPVRQIIFANCASCHGIDEYAYNARDRAGWNAHLEATHRDDLKSLISDADRDVLLEWLVAEFGPETKPFPRAYVPPEITTFFSDAEAETLLGLACTACHALDRVNEARFSPDRWRVVTVDMRERGAEITDEEMERLVEWLGRTKGTNPNE